MHIFIRRNYVFSKVDFDDNIKMFDITYDRVAKVIRELPLYHPFGQLKSGCLLTLLAAFLILIFRGPFEACMLSNVLKCR